MESKPGKRRETVSEFLERLLENSTARIGAQPSPGETEIGNKPMTFPHEIIGSGDRHFSPKAQKTSGKTPEVDPGWGET